MDQSINSSNYHSNHRPSNASRTSRSAIKSSLKRSRSLHCPKSCTNHEPSPGMRWNPGPGINSINQKSNNIGNTNQYYANRRHHSSNDYNTIVNDHCQFPFPINSSSHNLYYQFQMNNNNNQNNNHKHQQSQYQSQESQGYKVSVPNATRSRRNSKQHQQQNKTQQHGSTSSGNSLADIIDDCVFEIGSMTINNENGRRPYAISTNSSSSSISKSEHQHQHQHQHRYHHQYSLIDQSSDNNSPEELLMENPWQLDEQFPLEPIPLSSSESRSQLNQRTRKIFGQDSRTASAGQYRFYLIRQQNYPPLYLENGNNRRRIYRILVLGYPSAGKSSLMEQLTVQLLTNERTRFNPSIGSELNERTNLLIHFLESDSFDKYLLQTPVVDYQPDMYLILYSVIDRDSFTSVKKTLIDLQRWDDVETKSIIIVANKSDLVRGRLVTRREGKELATSNHCKYIETSCTIGHNIDVLLQGIGSQILLKEEQQQKQKEMEQSESFGLRAKRKPSFFKRILRKTAINKSKSCDNLHVL